MSRSQSTLFSILIIIVGFVGGYLYYTQFGSEPVVVESAIITRNDLEAFESMNVDFSILDKETFRNLQKLGESPVDAGPAGKKDIFAPIP